MDAATSSRRSNSGAVAATATSTTTTGSLSKEYGSQPPAKKLCTTTATKQQKRHPASGVFLNHQLSWIDNESRKLRGSIKHLRATLDFFAKIEISLRDGGHVMSTSLLDNRVKFLECGQGIQIDPTTPRPLMDFISCTVRMMGQTASILPMLGFRVYVINRNHNNGKIKLTFWVSKGGFFGELKGLSNEDTARLIANRSYAERQISTYLQTGVGLQNAASVTFTPLALALEISPILLKTLSSLYQFTNRESIKNELTSKLAVKSINDIGHAVKSSLNKGPVRSEQQLIETLAAHNDHYHSNLLSMMVLNQEGLRCNNMDVNESRHQSQELIMSTLAAFGHTNDKLNLLVDNRLVKNEYYFLREVQEMMGMVEIDHPGLHFKVSLRDGWVEPGFEECWHCSIDTYADSPELLKRVSDSSPCNLRVSLSGVRLRTEAEWGDSNNDGFEVIGFTSILENGVDIISGDLHANLDTGETEIRLDFTQSCIESILALFGIVDPNAYHPQLGQR